MHRTGFSVDIDHALYDANGKATGLRVDPDRDSILTPIACMLSLHLIPEGKSIHYEYGPCPPP